MGHLLLSVVCVLSICCLTNSFAAERDGVSPGPSPECQGQAMVTKDRHHKTKASHDHAGVLSAYAKASHTIPAGQQESTGTIDTEHPYLVVPLSPDHLNKYVGYNSQTQALIAKKSGVYLAEFYLQLYGPVLNQVAIALRKTSGTNVCLLTPTKLPPMLLSDFAPIKCLASGTRQELLHLSEKDELQLVIVHLPITGSPPVELPWYYLGSSSSETSEVAYLSLIKIE